MILLNVLFGKHFSQETFEINNFSFLLPILVKINSIIFLLSKTKQRQYIDPGFLVQRKRAKGASICKKTYFQNGKR